MISGGWGIFENKILEPLVERFVQLNQNNGSNPGFNVNIRLSLNQYCATIADMAADLDASGHHSIQSWGSE